MRKEAVPMQADRKKLERLLNTARGQIDGILNMMEEDRYCLDISQQVMACQSILARVNREILTAHLSHCVKCAKSDAEREAKVEELSALLGKLIP